MLLRANWMLHARMLFITLTDTFLPLFTTPPAFLCWGFDFYGKIFIHPSICQISLCLTKERISESYSVTKLRRILSSQKVHSWNRKQFSALCLLDFFLGTRHQPAFSNLSHFQDDCRKCGFQIIFRHNKCWEIMQLHMPGKCSFMQYFRLAAICDYILIWLHFSIFSHNILSFKLQFNTRFEVAPTFLT